MNAMSDLVALHEPESWDSNAPVVVASTPDDMTQVQLLHWIDPVLQAVPGRNWLACELEWTDENALFARYRTGQTPVEIGLFADWSAEEVRRFKSVVPHAASITLILQEHYTDQLVSLLDGVANWIHVLRRDMPELQPLMDLFARFEDMMSRVGNDPG